MYDNIGEKLKKLAKIMFIVEAIGTVITGIILIATSKYLMLAGLLTLCLGPVGAWVSSLPLYGLGELINITYENENNIKQILKKLNEKSTTNNIELIGKKIINKPTVDSHQWRCDGCGNMITQTPCEYCGKE